MTGATTAGRLGLDLTVFRLDPETSEGRRDGNDADVDGHFISYMVAPMARNMTCRASICCAVDHQEAAIVLRKLADRIEQHGRQLLKLDPGQLGHFDSNGVPVDDSELIEPRDGVDVPGTEKTARD